jgi:hypothetical protein
MESLVWGWHLIEADLGMRRWRHCKIINTAELKSILTVLTGWHFAVSTTDKRSRSQVGS